MDKVVTLTISVMYSLNGTSEAEIRGILERAANHLAENGLLSGETDATVEEWEAKVS